MPAPVRRALSPLMEPLIRVATGRLLVPHGAQKLSSDVGGSGLAGTDQCLEVMGYAPGFAGALALGSLEFFGGFLLALWLFT